MGSAAMVPAIDSTIIGHLGAIPEVERVYVIRGAGEGLRVLTIVNEEDDDVYERIYLEEAQIAQNLRSVGFDFSVVARRGGSIDLLMGKNVPIWVRPVSECPQLISI